MARRNQRTISAQGPDEDEIEKDWYVFDSSRVAEAAYDRESQNLFVRFQRPGQTVVYTYEGVQSNEWNNLKRSQSPGKFVNRVLNAKDYHPYRGSNL
jgi:hypothetical protein